MQLKNCLCLGTKQKKAMFDGDEQLVSLDGNRYFPSCFASRDFMMLQDKRRVSGIRRMSASGKGLGQNLKD